MPDGVQIPGGPVFIGFPQPPDVPCDPTGDGWRGPPGPPAEGGPFLPLVGGTLTRTGVSPDPSPAPILTIDYTGPGSSNAALQVNVTPTDLSGDNLPFGIGNFPWAIASNITLNGSGHAQPVGITSTITRNSGGSPAFCYYAQILDNTGGAYLNPTTSLNSSTGGVPFECDFFTNGSEPSTVTFNPNSGGRAMFAIGMAAQLFPQWASSTVYAAGAIINPFNTTLNPTASVYVYKATTSGTSSGSEPHFPTSIGGLWS